MREAMGGPGAPKRRLCERTLMQRKTPMDQEAHFGPSWEKGMLNYRLNRFEKV
jgi:hypothetical protein